MQLYLLGIYCEWYTCTWFVSVKEEYLQTFGGVVRMEYWTKYSHLRESNKVKNVTECKEFRSFC